MKTFLACFALVALCGCTFFKRPPTAAESKIYNIKTNVVEVVATNSVPTGTYDVVKDVVNPVTGVIQQVHVTGTNWSATIVTNRIETYVYENKPMVDTGLGLAGTFGGPWGTLAAVIVGGAYALWAKLRSGKLENIAETLVQNVEQVRAASKSATGYNDAAVMKEVTNLQRINQVKGDIHAIVEEHTP